MKKDWNELEFTNIADFKRMAPSIIQLEISRIGKIIDSRNSMDLAYNLLIKARFDLKEFRNDLETVIKNKMNENNLFKLYSALFHIAGAAENDPEIKSKTDYIIDRLNDLIYKCKMLY